MIEDREINNRKSQASKFNDIVNIDPNFASKSVLIFNSRNWYNL